MGEHNDHTINPNITDENPCGCINRVPLKPKRKRRFSGCGILDIDPSVVKTWFRVESSMYASAQQLLLNQSCMRMEILRKGTEDPFASYDAFSTDNDGNVSFYWDDEFLNRPPGFYLGDVFFNEQYCFTVQFRIRRCESVITACRNEHESPCHTQCDDAIGAANCPEGEAKPCIPQDVIDTAVPTPDPCSQDEDECGSSNCSPGAGSTEIGVGDE